MDTLKGKPAIYDRQRSEVQGHQQHCQIHLNPKSQRGHKTDTTGHLDRIPGAGKKAMDVAVPARVTTVSSAPLNSGAAVEAGHSDPPAIQEIGSRQPRRAFMASGAPSQPFMPTTRLDGSMSHLWFRTSFPAAITAASCNPSRMESR